MMKIDRKFKKKLLNQSNKKSYSIVLLFNRMAYPWFDLMNWWLFYVNEFIIMIGINWMIDLLNRSCKGLDLDWNQAEYNWIGLLFDFLQIWFDKFELIYVIEFIKCVRHLQRLLWFHCTSKWLRNHQSSPHISTVNMHWDESVMHSGKTRMSLIRTRLINWLKRQE